MKTGAYWLKFLTEKEQEEFKTNSCNSFDFKMAKDYNDFDEFICSSFRWDRTKQGHNYWHEISQRKKQINMERENLYKAIHKFTGEWVYGYYFKDGVTHRIFELNKESVTTSDVYIGVSVHPETVCKFWKTSKKAGKLFEGDKVKVQGSKRVGTYETEIIFDGTMFTLKENKTAFIKSSCFVGIIEVIGNIHD